MNKFFKNPISIVIGLILIVGAVMMMGSGGIGEWIYNTLLIIPAVIIGLSFHEYAHAKVAYALGDSTPMNQGRVTLNPKAHIDPIGFLALMFIHFGWGKPVMINPLNFKRMRRDNFLVSIAGITMNFLLAIVFAGLLKVLVLTAPVTFLNGDLGGIVLTMIYNIVYINIVLMVFNLLPVPPLDGFGIITEIFDLRKKDFYYKIYDKGYLILIVLLLFNIVDTVISPIINVIYSLVMNIYF